MKNLILALALLIVSFAKMSSQLTFDFKYSPITTTGSSSFYFTKFNTLGFKYVLVDQFNKIIKLYNVNHSLYSTINIPSSVSGGFYVAFVSDNLFDLTNDIEYVVVTTASPSLYSKMYIFKDNGTQIFYKDSANIGRNSDPDVTLSQNAVFYDGTALKMRVIRYSNGTSNASGWEVYTLPGVLPCVSCSNGTITGIGERAEQPSKEAIFYPNPVSDQLKLKYTLPMDYKTAEIKIYDLQGKNIENYKIENTFEYLYLPSNFNNGMYLYSLYVDNTLIKSEKVILTK